MLTRVRCDAMSIQVVKWFGKCVADHSANRRFCFRSGRGLFCLWNEPIIHPSWLGFMAGWICKFVVFVVLCLGHLWSELSAQTRDFAPVYASIDCARIEGCNSASACLLTLGFGPWHACVGSRFVIQFCLRQGVNSVDWTYGVDGFVCLWPNVVFSIEDKLTTVPIFEMLMFWI